MSKIKNMEDLRNHAVEALEKLSRGEIDTTQAGVTGKLCESIISTIKTQIEYARMVDEETQIPFMQLSHQPTGRTIDHELIEDKPKRKSLTYKD